MSHILSGVYAAAVTPLQPDLSPDVIAIASLLDFFAQRGCHGALLLGTTGEGPSMAIHERIAIFKAGLEVHKTCPDFKLLAGTTTPSLEDTITLTRAAFDMGYNGVVCLPPFYYRKASDEGLFTWFDEIFRRAVPGDGFLLGYHFPGVAGIGFSMNLLRKLKDSYPLQFAGIKDSSHDEVLARQLGDEFGENLAVFTGTDTYLDLAMKNHAVGCITAPANLISPDLRNVWDVMNSGQATPPTMERICSQRHVLEKYPPFPPTLKALLHRLHGFPLWAVKPPLEILSTPKEEILYQEFCQVV